MKTFESFGLSEDLNKSLSKMDYTTPTPIQAQAIPMALDGHDILGSAQTGTGKTAAFSIPLVEKILSSKKGGALVLTPTRELAKQVFEVIHQLLGHKSPINTAFIIGGEPMGKQLNQLKRNPRIIVGTPGRINDHLERKTIDLRDTDFLVLDETDRMLDMGFGVQLDRIIKFLPEKRQTLMFSATLPSGIVKLSSKYLNKPQRISVGETNVIAKNIKQEVVRIEQGAKYQELLNQLYDRTGSVIVFIKTKHGADRMAKNLRRDGFTSEALHGDLRQNKRDKVMQNFRKKNFRVLIATDIAARGLDVPHIEHVINYDLPQVAEDYIHRMGRTARAGSTGSAISFVSNPDKQKWAAIERLLDPNAKPGRGGNERGNRKGKPRRSSGGFKGNRDRKRNGSKHESSEKRGYKKRDDKDGDGKKPFKKKFDGKGPRKNKNKDNDRDDDRNQDGKKRSYKKRDDKDSDGKKPFKKKFEGKGRRNSRDSGKSDDRKKDDEGGTKKKKKPYKPYKSKSGNAPSKGRSFKNKKNDGSSPRKRPAKKTAHKKSVKR